MNEGKDDEDRRPDLRWQTQFQASVSDLLRTPLRNIPSAIFVIPGSPSLYWSLVQNNLSLKHRFISKVSVLESPVHSHCCVITEKTFESTWPIGRFSQQH